ncbi:MAG: dihydrofolate reductase [Porphyromonas sp.]|nr:dihydrofolate reductase [Porphyromonas sp.]
MTNFLVDKFADILILRYDVNGFEKLSRRRQMYLYFLSEATLRGRDILFDQHHPNNLFLREALSEMIAVADPQKESSEYEALLCFYKQVLFTSGIHHHYSEKKHEPLFRPEYISDLWEKISEESLSRWKESGFDKDLLLDFIYNKECAPIRTAESVEESSVNFYDRNITTEEVDAFYSKLSKDSELSPGLQSKLRKDAENNLYEEIYSTSGRYAPALKRISSALKAAYFYADSDEERRIIELLVSYYKSGADEDFRSYSLAWLKHNPADTGADFINGFIETYQDPLGRKGTWEGLVQLYDTDASKRTKLLADNAQWFEDRSPVNPNHRKPEVKGIQASVIEALMLGGDCYPASPLGINLPNNNVIRERYGSKSVTLSNISHAVDTTLYSDEYLKSFFLKEEVRTAIKTFGCQTNDLHTDLHECLGHGSGRLEPGVSEDALKEWNSTIEEARADLYALYYVADPKLVEMGLLPADAYKAQYDLYITNGAIIQLARLKEGETIQESHMRNRALIARYLLEKCGKECIELKLDEGDFFIEIYSYTQLREEIGHLLYKIQEIKSKGLYKEAEKLIRLYATEVPAEIYKSAKRRFDALRLSPFKGFINPRMNPEYAPDGSIKGFTLDMSESYLEQMSRYNETYKTLPLCNDDPNSAKSKVLELGTLHETFKHLRRRLHNAMDGMVAESMRKGGVEHRTNFGVTLFRLKEIAKTMDADEKLIEALRYQKEVREFPLLSIYLSQDKEPDYLQAIERCGEVETLEEAEQLVRELLLKQSYAYTLAEDILYPPHHNSFVAAIPHLLLAQASTQKRTSPPSSTLQSWMDRVEYALSSNAVSSTEQVLILRCLEKILEVNPSLTNECHTRFGKYLLEKNPFASEIESILSFFEEE